MGEFDTAKNLLRKDVTWGLSGTAIGLGIVNIGSWICFWWNKPRSWSRWQTLWPVMVCNFFFSGTPTVPEKPVEKGPLSLADASTPSFPDLPQVPSNETANLKMRRLVALERMIDLSL